MTAWRVRAVWLPDGETVDESWLTAEGRGDPREDLAVLARPAAIVIGGVRVS